jgi:ABC-type multidrug transport system fused ATPase/permease subunit
VMKCDKIMVLSFGKLIEFDSPANLMKNEQSYFYSIITQMQREETNLKEGE